MRVVVVMCGGWQFVSVLCATKDNYAAMVGLGVSAGNALSAALAPSTGVHVDLTGSQDVGALQGEGVLKSTAVAGLVFNAMSTATLLPTLAFHRFVMCLGNSSAAAAAIDGASSLTIQFGDITMDQSWMACSHVEGLAAILASGDVQTASASSVAVFADYATSLLSGLGETVLAALQLSFTASVDYIVALVWSFQDILATYNMRACKVPNYALRYVLDCACGDAPYRIPSPQRGHGWADGGLWCAGTLSLVRADGTLGVVYNPYALDALSAGVRGITAYVECLSAGGNAVDGSACTPPPSEQTALPVLVQQGVDPLAVWARCKSNYGALAWDVGAGALFAPPSDASSSVDPVPDSVRAAAVAWAAGVSPALLACLQDPTRMRVGYDACLRLFFSSPQATPASSSSAAASTPAAYFVYTPLLPLGSQGANAPPPLAEPPDACLVFSGLQNASAPGSPLRTLMDDCAMEEGVGAVAACDLNPLMLHAGSAGARVKLGVAAVHGTTLPVASSGAAAGAAGAGDALYAAPLATLQAAYRAFNATFPTEAAHIDAMLFSADGDFLHDFIDCMVLGPYTRIDLRACDAEVRFAPRLRAPMRRRRAPAHWRAVREPPRACIARVDALCLEMPICSHIRAERVVTYHLGNVTR